MPTLLLMPPKASYLLVAVTLPVPSARASVLPSPLPSRQVWFPEASVWSTRPELWAQAWLLCRRILTRQSCVIAQSQACVKVALQCWCQRGPDCSSPSLRDLSDKLEAHVGVALRLHDVLHTFRA